MAHRGCRDLEPGHEDTRTRIRRGCAAKVFLQKTGWSDRVLARVGATDADILAALLVMTAAFRRGLGGAPRLAEQRGVGPGGKQQHDGQDGGAEHSGLWGV